MIDVMVWVLNHSEAQYGNRLVLLALAEYAHKDGSRAYPKLAELAHRARLSPRQTQNALKELTANGAIERTGATPGGVNVYRVLMTKQAATLGGVKSSRGEKSNGEGVQSATSRGAKSRDAHIKEPSKGTVSRTVVDAAAPTPGEAPLSHLLADLIAANDPDGSRPNVGKRWADAERRLQEIDKRSPEQIEVVIRWAQADEFWRSNILSMPKLREKYPALVQKALTKAPQRGGKAAAQTDQDVLALRAARERLEKEGR